MALTWNNVGGVPPRSYVCGYCNHTVGPAQGWQTTQHRNVGNMAVAEGYVYICSFCGKPTYFDLQEKQYPGASAGNEVLSLPKDVAALYDEARRSMTVNSFTAAVLTCRKLLMHLAVEKGAPDGKTFLEYVEYLSDKGYVPPDGKGWVDHIRKKGNEANHRIKIMLEADAKDLIGFSEMLLKFVYEFPAKVPPPPAATTVASSTAAGPVVASSTPAKPSVP
jgi:DNA-directed RNA polymerase subunit RPC12/RpoP